MHRAAARRIFICRSIFAGGRMGPPLRGLADRRNGASGRPRPTKGPPERAGEGTRPYGVLYFVGAGHWPARICGAPYTKKRSIIAPSSAPVCALGHLPPRGKACRRLTAAPTADIEAVPFSRRGRSQTGPTAYVPGALVRKPRRKSGTAPAAIFANPGPGGPAGIQTLTQISARRKFFAWFKG